MKMKKMLRAMPIAVALTFLVVLLVGISPNSTLVGSGSASASPMIAEAAIWDVSTTFSTSDVMYSSDGSLASYDVASVAGTLSPVYYDTSEVPQDLQDSANQMIYDVNNGAVTGVMTVDLGYAESEYYNSYSYVPVEFSGTYDTEYTMRSQQEMQMQTKGLRGPRRDAQRYDRNLLVASLNPSNAYSGMRLSLEPSAMPKNSFKTDFKISGMVERGKSPGKSSMTFSAEEDQAGNNKFKMKNSKFNAPGLGFGGADFKVKDWGNSPKDSIKSSMKKHELQLDVESVQMDAATGTMSVKQRASLKKQK
jgi:hypothetical protein